MIKVAAFTTGQHKPGSRFRVRQYIPALREHGIELSEFYTRLGAYPTRRRWIRPVWALGALSSQVPNVVQSYRHHLTLFQREMISTFFTLERFTKGPRILDVDDAIWLYRDGSFVHRLAGISDSVICGNSFLAEHFSRWNSSITILPTAVDTDRFITLASRPANENLTIGWSGGYEGGPDLKVAEAALQIVLNRNPNVRLRVISDQPPCLNLPPGQMEFVRWTPETEVRAIQTLDIGIMPLRDTLWSRGKCAYKMLLYMSCGVPAVVSPVGMCGEVCNLAEVGISAGTTQDWVEALEELLRDTQLRTAMGAKARDIIEQKFSIHQLAPKLAAELARVAERNRN